MQHHLYSRRRTQVGAALALLAINGQTPAIAQATPERLFMYPNFGQTVQQQEKDRFECHQWAVSQTGYDPNLSTGNESAEVRTDYLRAISACLEGRGYTVR